VLRLVPNDLREASQALAAPEWRTVWSVVLPTARSGMITATLLGIAVAIGETAPLLLTIFGANVMNWNPFHGKQAALPLIAFQEVRLSLVKDVNFGYTAALVLFMLVFTIFILARILGSQWLGNKVRERSNRIASARSKQTAEAYEARSST
jgi:phosphate transport system permease protein